MLKQIFGSKMSDIQKYELLLILAREVREYEPICLVRLDILLERWMHKIPKEADFNPLRLLINDDRFLEAEKAINRLYEEEEWIHGSLV